MYRVTTVKTLSGSVIPVPEVTCESKPKAIEAMESAIADAENELNAPYMRLVGGRIEITLEECAHTIGGGTDVLQHVIVKRPVNSPRAETFRRDS